MQKHYTVYKTTNVCNGKFYIGKHATPNLNDGYLGSGVVLSHAIKKYSKENFVTECLFCFDNPLQMEEKELELVDLDLVNDPNCYNIALGGQGGNLGPIVNAKISLAMKGLLTGIPKTTEHKLAISRTKSGVPQDPIVVAQRAKTCKDNRSKMTQEERNERFGNKGSENGFYNKSHSEESKQKIRDTIGSTRTGALNANAKSITIDGVTYQTHKECMQSLSLSKRKLKKLKESLGI